MNILFITADQWRGECLSCLGHPVIKTPHLDHLANQGVTFTQHYAQATPCAPSRTSLHTGMYLQNHRCVLNGTPVDRRFTNWAIEIKKKGYISSLFGYTDSAMDPRGLSPNDARLSHYSEPLQGIDSFTPIHKDVSLLWIEYLKERGYTLPNKLWDCYGETKAGIEWEHGGDVPLPLAISSSDHETSVMVDACMDWIKAQNQSWITHLSLLRPHPPFVAPEPYNSMYDPSTLDDIVRKPTIEEESQQHPYLECQLNAKKYGAIVEKYRASDNTQEIRRKKASYYGLMTEVDDQLGRLFDFLKQNGQWDNTLIIFTSDHGEQMGDHWLTGKLGYFDPSYHIPLIIRDPRQESKPMQGKMIDAFTENIDIMPTMLEFVDLSIPSQCDGYSLMPFLTSAQTPDYWRNEVHWEFDFRDWFDPYLEKHLNIAPHQCTLNVIRDNHYKYVHFTALPPLLFDVKNDPHEFINLANDPQYQLVALQYAQKMLSWRMNHDDPGLTETFLSDSGPVTRRSH
ncbi:MAG: sulfatase-like hydrolase/transferase [Gammaproteobacteria bacterium]|nr:sulfatase-like hydrolase/transferase [Gammaproteobacteria bacterium]